MNRLTFPRTGPPVAVPIIIATNIAVFFAWYLSLALHTESGFMIHNFLVSWSELTRGRVWILLTAAFSHNMFWHLLINMYVLDSFGPIIEHSLGLGRFVRFYLLAGLVSSLSHAVVSAWILNRPDLPALGASGAISGVVLLFALMFPRQKILLLGLIPIPAAWGALLFVGLDLWGLIAQASGGGIAIGHGAHLGGALTGLLYYFIYIQKGAPKFQRQH
jgi:membrane associated rhomboid family serine protease